MDKYDCSCGGENPVCHKCDGTGMVPSQSLGLRKTSVTKLAKERQLIHGDKSARISEKNILSSNNFGLKSSSVKFVFEEYLKKRQKTSADFRECYKFCPYCAILVKNVNIRNHLDLQHQSGRGLPLNLSVWLTSAEIQLLQKIIKDKKITSESRFKKFFGLSNFNYQSIVPSSVETENSVVESLGVNNHLDGSRYYSGSYRDNGQFGSYSSFDSCDDESHP
jgi:hypothetical protein